ncbi:MAG: hypothetical protein HY961_00955 [Ignavibacteriae bacterium]|nr:hypothetical protein [Ignavibacteriota bacterium]
MNTQRDFLQIPDGEAVTITLKYNTGLLRNGQFGKYFIYTVMHEGKEKLLKVTERLEKQFRKQNVQGGQEIRLGKTSVTPENGEPYSIINLVVEEGKAQPPANSLLAEQQNEQLTVLTESADEMHLLSNALSDARSICKNLDDPSVIPEVTLAVGLFLARTIRTTITTKKEPTNHSRRAPRKPAKPASEPDKEPVAAAEKKDDDLPF